MDLGNGDIFLNVNAYNMAIYLGHIAQLQGGQANVFCKSQLILYLMPAMSF